MIPLLPCYNNIVNNNVFTVCLMYDSVFIREVWIHGSRIFIQLHLATNKMQFFIDTTMSEITPQNVCVFSYYLFKFRYWSHHSTVIQLSLEYFNCLKIDVHVQCIEHYTPTFQQHYISKYLILPRTRNQLSLSIMPKDSNKFGPASEARTHSLVIRSPWTASDLII